MSHSPYLKPSIKQLKEWRKLRQKKYREKSGWFIAEGVRCVEQLLNNGLVDIVNLIVEESFDDTGIFAGDDNKWLETLKIYSLPVLDFTGIADTENPQGIVAVCRIPDIKTPEIFKDNQGIVIATDAIQDPGNLGTIIRTAVWFGARGIICGNGTVDPWHPKVVRSTAGATGALPLLHGNLAELFIQFEEMGWQIWLLEGGKDAVPLNEIEKVDKTVLVVGNEANGIQPELLRSNRQKVKINGNPEVVESLNAAIALGIALYGLGH